MAASDIPVVMNVVPSRGGPRTRAGRDRSSKNALRHGLRADRLTLMPWENRRVFGSLHEALHADLEPDGALEAILVERIVGLVWRLRRAGALESATICVGYFDTFDRWAKKLRTPVPPPHPPKPDWWWNTLEGREAAARGEKPEPLPETPKPPEPDPSTWPDNGKRIPRGAEGWPNEGFGPDGPQSLDRIMRYTVSLENRLDRAIRELQRLQDRRAGRERPRLDVTVDVRGDDEGSPSLPNEPVGE